MLVAAVSAVAVECWRGVACVLENLRREGGVFIYEIVIVILHIQIRRNFNIWGNIVYGLETDISLSTHY